MTSAACWGSSPGRAAWTEGRPALMDGYTGTVYIDPEQEQLEQLRELYQANGRPKSFAAV